MFLTYTTRCTATCESADFHFVVWHCTWRASANTSFCSSSKSS